MKGLRNNDIGTSGMKIGDKGERRHQFLQHYRRRELGGFMNMVL